MVIARFVNWPDSLSEIGIPVPWDPGQFLDVAERRAAKGEKFFGAAYMIPATGGRPGQSKAVALVENVFTPLWKDREIIRPKLTKTLAQSHKALMAYKGLGSFLAAQVIADLKSVQPLRSAPDWFTWAAPGPGSMRGLNEVLGRRPERPWSDQEWQMEFRKLCEEVRPRLRKFMPPLHAQDIQNCLCEYSKFCRGKRGERLKRRYKHEHATAN
jgi:hypothetical protein